MEGLSHAVIGDLAKIGERGFGDDGAEVRVGVEGLEELCGAHGFAESEDAGGRPWLQSLGLQKIEPLVNVVAFKEAVGGDWAIAGAVGAGVGEENGESVGEEELGVSGHAEAVVAEAVKEEGGVAIGVMGTDDPGTERGVVGSDDGGVGEVGVQRARGVAD